MTDFLATAVEDVRQELAADIDQHVHDALAIKYEHLTKPADLYQKIAECYSVIAHVLAHPALTDSGAPRILNQLRRQRDVGGMTIRARSGMSFRTNIKFDAKSGARMILDLPVLWCAVTGKSDTEAHNASFVTGRKLLSAIFPDMHLDRLQVRNGVVLDPNVTSVLPLETISAMNLPGVGKVDLSSWNKGYRGMVKFSLVVKSLELTDGSAAEKLGDYNDFQARIMISAEITFPAEYALWSISADEKDFVPVAFWGLTKRLQTWWTRDDSKGKAPDGWRQHPDVNAKISERVAKKFALRPRKRTNAEGFCTVPSGQMYWIPDSKGSVNFTNLLNSIVDEDGKIDFDAVKSIHVGTDWIIDKMFLTDSGRRIDEEDPENKAYMSDTGHRMDPGLSFHVVDLTGARPLVPAVIAHIQRSRVDGNILANMVRIAEKLGVKGISLGPITRAGERLTWDEMMDVPFDPKEGSPINQQLWDIGRLLGEAYDKLVASNLSVFEQYEIRPYFALFGPYAKKRKEFADILGKQFAMHRSSSNFDPGKPIQLVDMPGVEGAMPHQGMVDAELGKFPLRAMLDISPGGGKSWTYINDVLKLLNAGKIKRAGIAMPRNLQAQFAQEVIKFTDGHLRPFIINTRVWNGFTRRIGTDPVAVKKLLDRQPRNTLFIIDYNWLSQEAETIVIGDSEEPFFPRANFLSDLGFDYFALDESQRAKNLTTSRTMATSILTATAAVHDDGTEGYVRVGSGTMIGDTPVDLVGQMAQLEPMALGPTLVESIRKNKRVLPEHRKDLDDHIESFAKRILVTRRMWAHLLPPVLERVWKCKMTEEQQKFYDLFMEEAQQELLKNDKVQKLMKKAEDGDENAEAKVETLLKRYFVKLEVWMNAPDSDFAGKSLGILFRNTDSVKPIDLVSPKMPIIEHILEGHFKGAHVDFQDGKGKVWVPADGNKVIIVGYNKAVSRHIFDHLSPQYQSRALHFTAESGDKVIQQFRDDPAYTILVADENNLSEGHNLQCASRLIRTQTMWTPGAQEQTMSRCWRPDVPVVDPETGEPKFKYHRPNIFLDWIIIEPSLDVPKMARMIGKLVDNGIAREVSKNPRLAALVKQNQAKFDQIKRIKMNLNMIRDKSLQTEASLDPQFQAYYVYKEWERGEFTEENDRLRKQVEQRVGHKVKEENLAALSMLPVKSTSNAEFVPPEGLQNLGYIPWIEGFTGTNKTDMNLVPLVVADPSDEGDDDADAMGDMDVNINVAPGDPVMTEFGPGIVTKTPKSKKTGGDSLWIYVQVPGFSDVPVKCLRFAVTAPADAASRAALMLMIKSAKQNGLATLKFDRQAGELQTRPAVIPPQTVKNYIEAGKKVAADEKLKTPEKQRREKIAPIGQAPLGSHGLDSKTLENLFKLKMREDPANHQRYRKIMELRNMKKRTSQQESLLMQLESERQEARRKAREAVRLHGHDALKIPQTGPAASPEATRIGGPAVKGTPRGPENMTPEERVALLRTLRMRETKKGLTPKETALMKKLIKFVQADKSGRSPTKAPGVKDNYVGKTDTTQPKIEGPIVVGVKNKEREERIKKSQEVTASVVLFNGVVCLLVDGSDKDPILLKNGFDRIGKSFRIRVKNPKAYLALVAQLSKKPYVIPPFVKQQLDQFGDIYEERRQQIAYMKAKELPFHAKWVRDQRKKAVTKGEIRPWPVVEDGLVYLYLNMEMCPATISLRQKKLPVGVVRPQEVDPCMISMCRNKAQVVQLIKSLREQGVNITNAKDVMIDLNAIKG